MRDMPDAEIDRSRFTRARRSLGAAESRLRATAVRLANAEAERVRLTAEGADEERITRAESRVADLRAEHDSLHRDIDGRAADLRDLSDAIVGVIDPARFVATLDGRTPIALLPVRLETRFLAGGTELRIRVYPDQVHLDAHEPELTENEVTAGHRYWRARWGADAAGRRAAWQEVAALGARRARWVIEQLTPANLADEATGAAPSFPDPPRKSESWTRPVRATALPDRWVAIGFRGRVALFRKWGTAIPDSLATTPTPDPNVDPNEVADLPVDAVPGDDPMRWVVDYDAAVEVGMAITVTDADLPGAASLRGGLDRLVVFGVDWTLTPEAAAARLEALLDAHRVSDGLSFVPQGTPTNNTAAGRAGMSSSEKAAMDEQDPDAAPADLPDDSAARRLVRAFGLEGDILDRAPQAGLLEARTASRLHEVLWTATLGHYLDELFDPLIDDDTVGLSRDHVVRWLHPGGPLASLRIGRQPYGVLPVVAPGLFVPDRPDGLEAKLQWLLDKARPVWSNAANGLPRMGRTGDPDTDLLELLQRAPLAMLADFHEVLGPSAVANTTGMEAHAGAQAWIWALWGQYLGLRERPEIARFVVDPKPHPLPVPWVQAGPLEEGRPLEPNYLQSVAATARSPAGRATLNDQVDADTLLRAFVAHAAVEELDRAASGLVLAHLGQEPIVARATAKALRTSESYGVLEEARRGRLEPGMERAMVTVATPRQQANLVIPELTGGLTVAEHVAGLVAVSAAPERPEVRTLASFLQALEELAARPAAEIDRGFRGFLDAASHRLDAWATSLATRRLDAVRGDRAVGVHLGGYGWVEDLHPGRTPDSLGFVHAPSLAHAATAAILRSGHLSHRDEEHEALDIQLSSDRVQRAMPVLQGVAMGQQLAALLGYRFERSLRESDVRLARYLLPIRGLAPLRPSGAPDGAGPVEAIAARDVVDGVRLLERWRNEGAGLLSGLGAPAGDRDAIGRILDDIATTFDAVGDILMAESVYQTVLGNYERAGAALAAIDKQQRPPEPEVVRTPRSGIAYTQRVLVAMGEDRAPEPWRALSRDPRATAAPRANAWAAHLLPEPSSIRFAGRLTTGEGGATERTASAADLGLSPLSLVLARATGASTEPSELEVRVAQALVSGVTLNEGDELVLLDEAPTSEDAETVGFGALRTLLDWMRALLTECRPATAEDLVPPGGDRATGIDLADLAALADEAATSLGDALDALDAVLADEGATAAALRRALEGAAAFGVPGAIPRAGTGTAAQLRAALRAQAGSVRDEAGRRRAQLDALGAGPAGGADGPALTEAAVVEHHTARLKAVFGDAFPVVPRFRVPASSTVATLSASLGDAESLTGGDLLAVRAWVDRLGMVRPGVDRLARVLGAAEVLGAPGAGGPSALVVQLPHRPGQRWLALQFADDGPADALVALAVHAPSGFDPGRSMAGLVCDEWMELVPSATEATGVTFHYDAPGARAPQCILLAVPPERRLDRWDFDMLLDTILEAESLSRVRGVTPAELLWTGGLLPAVYLPNNFTKDRPSVDLLELANVHMAGVKYAAVAGKGWAQ
jgi:hypothetical protein